MNMSTAIEPVSVLKARSTKLIRQARDSRQPIIITQQGKATAVLQDVESYEEQRRSLLLLKLLARGDREFEAGKMTPHEKVKERFSDMLKGLSDDN